MASHNQGTLRIRPLGAKLERDLGLTSMDPYCVIRIGNQEKISHVSEKGGMTPRWDERFEFNPEAQEENILISLWDKRTLTGDQEIGSANVPLSKVFRDKIFDEWVEIFYKDEKAGAVWLIMDIDQGEESTGRTGEGLGYLNKSKSHGKEGQHKETSHQTPQQDINRPQGLGKGQHEEILHQKPEQEMQAGAIPIGGGIGKSRPERQEVRFGEQNAPMVKKSKKHGLEGDEERIGEPKAPIVKKSKKHDLEGEEERLGEPKAPKVKKSKKHDLEGEEERLGEQKAPKVKKSKKHDIEGQEERPGEPKAPIVKKSKKHERPYEHSPKRSAYENPEEFPPRSKPAAHLGTESRNVHEESSPKYIGIESPEVVPSHTQRSELEPHSKHPESIAKHPEQSEAYPEKAHKQHPEYQEGYIKHPEQETYSHYPKQQETYTKQPEIHTNYPEKETRQYDMPPAQSKQAFPLTEGSYHSGVGTEGKQVYDMPPAQSGSYHSGVGTEGKQVYEAKPKPVQGVEKMEGVISSSQERYEDVTQRPKEGYQDQPKGKIVKETVKVVTEMTQVEYATGKKAYTTPGEKSIEKEKGQTGTYSEGGEGKIVKP
ncbi:unnamed protein product [Blepharisma stoltei]|uniref:C2 domain-containing protein n=1 Tax=Blepharisma stoltei TaxID=1481888 RepID=A0AAU9K8B5_9CILI|nr:unnamed protein product [Blepharisma stoltei]